MAAKAKAAISGPGFSGFPKATTTFLKGIAAHNDKAWFEAHRDLYDAGYVAPARAFVEALGPKLRAISPEVQFEPKVNGSLGRINRDIRFSKDKRPYKDHLDLWFWHGDRKGWACPGFWFRLTANEVYLGVGMHHFEKEQLEAFRNSVVHPRSGRALQAVAKAIETAGHEVGGKSRKLPPRGFETEPERAEFLLYEALYTGTTLPVSSAGEPDFAEACAKHYASVWPLGQWLLEEVSA
ncbi:MAG TPA: DUF2461 domain-containing protein [Devosia sp.]|nr:DUF2461 domain-containing protein [Devosia sp.]